MDSIARPRLTKDTIRKLPVLCTDGAWGTELMKLGGKPGELKDLWNLSAPEKVYQVARSYVDAGSAVILTNTFSSNRVILGPYGEADRAAALTRAGVEISKRAADGRAWVFASMGPTGKMVSMEEIAPRECEEAYAEQAAAMAAGGADAIVIETQADLEEARAALKGCQRATSLPVGVSFTFDAGKDKTRTLMGVTVAQAHALARSMGASFVGANCGVGMESYVAVARLFAQCGDELPIWIKGNAGKPEVDSQGNTVYRATPEDFVRTVEPLLAAGAKFIGGCCGSTPEHIRRLAQVLEARKA